MMIDYCSIGKRIKLTRIKQGVLQKDLAVWKTALKL